MLKIFEWVKKNWKLCLFVGVIIYASITTYLYAHLNGLYNDAIALTESLQGRIDTEMRDLKDALTSANKAIGEQQSTLNSQQQLIGQLKAGEAKLRVLYSQLEQTNQGLVATNQRLGELIDSITGLQQSIETGNSDALAITQQCLDLIQQIEDGLR
jgi:chromosome segregation ATPase